MNTLKELARFEATDDVTGERFTLTEVVELIEETCADGRRVVLEGIKSLEMEGARCIIRHSKGRYKAFLPGRLEPDVPGRSPGWVYLTSTDSNAP